MSEWFENESFWKEFYPFLFSDEKISGAEGEVEAIFSLCDFKEGTVLDLCCGPGRHSVVMANMGCSVTAVDSTEYLLEKAKELSRKKKANVEWVRDDMRMFQRPGTYDLVISMFTSFGYFEEKSEDRKVLKNIYDNLKPGGSCFFEMIGKEVLARHFQPTATDLLPDGSQVVQNHHIYDGWSRFRIEWTLLRQSQATSYQLYHTIYSGQEMLDRLKEVGFEDVRLYGDMEGGEYGVDASTLVIVGKKPG